MKPLYMSIAEKEVCASLMAPNPLIENAISYASHDTGDITNILISIELCAVALYSSHDVADK